MFIVVFLHMWMCCIFFFLRIRRLPRWQQQRSSAASEVYKRQVEEFLEKLPQVDDYFAQKIESLKKQGKVLRMGASIKDGKVSVGMMEVGQDDPLYGVRGGENAFVFYTERYQPIPLTVRGYGAGAGVTAAGVFGDILRTGSFNPER